jgi:hypothetical protein
MKKIFFIFGTVCLGLFLNCFKANAQYITEPLRPESSSVQKVNLFALPEYRLAQEKSNKGRTLFFVGLGAQVAGTALMLVPTSKTTTIEDNHSFYTETTLLPFGAGCFVIGGITTLTGTILEIIGAVKWINGTVAMRDLRIAYALNGNGVVLMF